jgi:hypothetical protein
VVAAYLRLTRLTLAFSFLLPALLYAGMKFEADGISAGFG